MRLIDSGRGGFGPLVFGLVIAFALFGVINCCTVARESSAQLVSHWRLIGPVARKGVTDDPTLTPESKTTRLRSIDEFEALLVEVANNASR